MESDGHGLTTVLGGPTTHGNNIFFGRRTLWHPSAGRVARQTLTEESQIKRYTDPWIG